MLSDIECTRIKCERIKKKYALLYSSHWYDNNYNCIIFNKFKMCIFMTFYI